jgi:ADP-L-glycero-D-manno-heptose 6-epimerase
MIVVTGGAGFIGSNLVAALNGRGDKAEEVVVCDRFDNGDKWRNLAKHELAALVPPEELFSFLDNHTDKISTIFHLGAISATTATDVDFLLRNNFTLSLDLWEWCAARGVRFIYASSAATYGDGAQGFDDDGSVEALARLRPLNPYGWSKHLFDRRIARLLRDNQAAPQQWAGLKFFNVYGPNEYHKEGQQSVVAHAYPIAAAGQPVQLFRSHNPDYEDGGQLRDFIWVGDCVEVMLWLLDHPEVNGLFNVGTGKARSFADLVGALFAGLGREPRIEYIDTPEAIRERYQYYTQADPSRLRQAGYDRPFTELEAGVAHYVRDYLSAPDPYR